MDGELYGHSDHDVTFLVRKGDEIRISFPANKLLLGLESPVFNRMFNGDFRESKQTEILIDDITPEAFHHLLQFLLRRPLNLSKTPVANVADLLYAAEKYAIESLKSTCLDCLKIRDVNFDNFWNFLTIISLYSLEHGNRAIKDKTLNFLDNNISDLITQSNFTRLDKRDLMLILDRKLENVNVEVVFHQVLIWARMQCFLQSKAATPENVRNVMEHVIYSIGFIQMPYEKFIRLVITSQILTKAEIIMFTNAILKGDTLLPDPWKIKSIKTRGKPPIRNRAQYHGEKLSAKLQISQPVYVVDKFNDYYYND